MENVYNIAITVLSALASIASISIGVIGFFTRSSQVLNVNDQSSDSMHDELYSELKKAKRRYLSNKVLYYTLSSISIIGGVMVSTVYFNEAFNEQIGIIGLFILLSSLLILIFRPLEKYQQANRDMSFLKRVERDYLCIDNIQEKITFLRGKLNEYDNRPIAD